MPRCMSPAVKTPGTLVRDPLNVRMYPLSSSSSWPLKSAVFGVWPMAMNTPSTGSSLTSPVRLSRSTSAVTSPFSASLMSTTSVFHKNEMFGVAIALSCITFDARNVSRRWITVTLVASFER